MGFFLKYPHVEINFKGWPFSCQAFGPFLDALWASPPVYWPAFVYTMRELKKQAHLYPFIPGGEQETKSSEFTCK